MSGTSIIAKFSMSLITLDMFSGRDGDMNNGVGGCCEGDGKSTDGSKTGLLN